ncbi:HET-domain-containing protein [Aspergillus ellipticus CBS 707.79]|uniref:HET-domain-containing protein n=1 Tax=Aspergillus ellipticus CBS 707.79 TaxID=1448320 RepID=A0A319DT14_9EURO|nr:HET-domain-containing protein [Aspergillus ellipticus CBS 707.79]
MTSHMGTNQRFGFDIQEFEDENRPPYAILSHRWDEEEVTFQDMKRNDAATKTKKGYTKIRQFCQVAWDNGIDYAWIDTCCIDRTNSTELSEAINSMYRWYQESVVCFVFLHDVLAKEKFQQSVWFSRGWTLQELIAPTEIILFNKNWKALGTKKTLQSEISERTGIPTDVLSWGVDLGSVSVAQKMSWAAKRVTSKLEDQAYCLLGLFGINMPILYGEGEKAFRRLQEEILKNSDDESLFAWCLNTRSTLPQAPGQ